MTAAVTHSRATCPTCLSVYVFHPFDTGVNILGPVAPAERACLHQSRIILGPPGLPTFAFHARPLGFVYTYSCVYVHRFSFSHLQRWEFGESPWSVGRYCSYLLPKQAEGTPQILNFKTLRMTGRPNSVYALSVADWWIWQSKNAIFCVRCAGITSPAEFCRSSSTANNIITITTAASSSPDIVAEGAAGQSGIGRER